MSQFYCVPTNVSTPCKSLIDPFVTRNSRSPRFYHKQSCWYFSIRQHTLWIPFFVPGLEVYSSFSSSFWDKSAAEPNPLNNHFSNSLFFLSNPNLHREAFTSFLIFPSRTRPFPEHFSCRIFFRHYASQKILATPISLWSSIFLPYSVRR